jgi:hypothetical protein
MTEIHHNSGTVMFNYTVNSKTRFGFRTIREKSIHPRPAFRSHSLKDIAFIVTFKSAQDLYELIWKTKLPLERCAEVKGNRQFRLMVPSEFHAWKELRRLKVSPEMVEDVYQMNG